MTEYNSTKFWGPSLWKVIHSFAVTYQPSQKTAIKHFIEKTLTTLIPCAKCREHLKSNLKRLPLNDYLENNDTLFLWTYYLHDLVNRQLKKKSPPYDMVKRAYFDSLGVKCDSCKI